MTLADRKLHLLISIPLLALALSTVARAQDTPDDAPADAPSVGAAEVAADAPETAADAASAPEAGTRSGYAVRSELGRILRQHPPELATLLALDPALLSNAEFLGRSEEHTSELQ